MPTSWASFARSLIRRWICSSTPSILARTASRPPGGLEVLRARTDSGFALLGSAERAAAPRPREVFLAAMVAASDEPRRENAGDAADLPQDFVAGRAVDVDQRVRILAPGLVEQIGDVDPGAGETGRDLPDHVGNVAVGDREARRAGNAGQHRLRVVDAVADVAVLQEIPHLIGHHDGAVLL